jgi:hypothetical protein
MTKSAPSLEQALPAAKSAEPEEKSVADPVRKTADELLGEDANALLLKLDALLETVNRIMIIIENNRKRAQGELSSYLKPLLDAQKSTTLSLNSGSQEFRDYSKLKKASDKAKLAERIVPQSFLISMVSQYDAFLVAAIKNLFLLKPEKIRSTEKTISVKDVAKFSSIEELLNALIEDELDEVLRGSHLSQIQWGSKKF